MKKVEQNSAGRLFVAYVSFGICCVAAMVAANCAANGYEVSVSPTQHPWIIDPMNPISPAASFSWSNDASFTNSNLFALQWSGALSPAGDSPVAQQAAGRLDQNLLGRSAPGTFNSGVPSAEPLRSLDHANLPVAWLDLGTAREQFSMPPGLGNHDAVRELVIIDRGVADWETLLSDLRSQQRDGRALDVVLLDQQYDGVQQISSALRGYQGLQSVHIISHGVADGVQLGNQWLRSGNLAEYAGELLGWRDALASGADLLFYGCNLAADRGGQDLVDGLGLLTGADVAASSDLTGHAQQGGNWELEYQYGQVEYGAAFTSAAMYDWQQILDGTININQAWLDAQGAGPYILNDDNSNYVLQTDVTTAGTAFYVSQKNITFDLNQHTISYGGAGGANKWGVCLYINWHNTEIVIPNSAEPTGFVLKNGSIINQGAGDRSHGVYGYLGKDSILENLYIETDGKDSATVLFGWENTTIRDCVLVSHTSSTFNRHSGPANVQVPHGKITAQRNVLIGGNSGFNGGSNSVIEKNVIRQSGFATNGYGGWFYEKSNVQMRDNIIIPTNGRGILANGGENHVYENNVILHLEAPNQEFGDALNSPAVRVRYDAKNIVYRNNTSLGIGGGSLTAASSFYLTNDGTGENHFVDNHATVILQDTPSIRRYAQPIALEGQGYVNPSNDQIDNNTLRSNHLMIRTSGFDGHAKQNRALIGNTYNWINGNSALNDFQGALLQKLAELSPNLTITVASAASDRINSTINSITGLLQNVELQDDRAFWYGKYAEFSDPAGSFTTILNSTFGAGVDAKTVTYSILSQGKVSLREGVSRRVQFMEDQTPLINFLVTMVSDQGDQFTVLTDNNGFADLTFLSHSLEKAEANSAPFNVLTRAQSTLTFSGYSDKVIQHNDIPAVINLGGSGTPPHQIEYQGTKLIAYANDNDNIVSWSANDALKLTMDGYVYNINPTTTEIEIYGRGGNDSIQLTGSAGDDFAELFFGDTRFNTNPMQVRAQSFEQAAITAGLGGMDSAIFHDSTADDLMNFTTVAASMSGTGYEHQAIGFTNVTANSTSGGNDLARLYDSSGDDQLVAHPTYALLSGPGYSHRANGFRQTFSYSSVGNDSANFYDSADVDHVRGDMYWSQMYGTNYDHRADQFAQVQIFGTANGAADTLIVDGGLAQQVTLDPGAASLVLLSRSFTATGFMNQTIQGSAASTAVVRLNGNSGNDSLQARTTHTILSGPGYSNRVNAFNHVLAYAGAGGSDDAQLFDSAGDDLFIAHPTWASLAGPNNQFSYQAHGFGTVTAFSSVAIIGDSAQMFDSAGNDVVSGNLNSIQFTGAGFSNRTENFKSVQIIASAGGSDSLNLADSIGNDNGWVGRNYLSWTGSGQQLIATGFRSQVLRSERGGTDSVYFSVTDVNNLVNMNPTFTGVSDTNSTYFHRANRFASVRAVANVGANTVNMFDSAGNDALTGNMNSLRFAGSGYSNFAEGFGIVRVSANAGGSDTLNLADSLGDDQVIVRMVSTSMLGSGINLQAGGFRNQIVRSERGGVDSVQLTARGSGNSVNMYESFTGMSDRAKTYYQRADNFANVDVKLENGGVSNQVFMYAASQLQTMEFVGNLGINRHGNRRRSFEDFNRVTAYYVAGRDQWSTGNLNYGLTMRQA
jgi:hypothetical protein